ncbi:MAG: TolC family protein [Burkholderiaceae bacterium]|nr:TolC family protein [Burkholderiaceae bacterium]MDO9089393.1 TolC family protein [Burkholderiaceae bacterium]MDP1968456.1 TolC family protein [Burkholderiaceae bacterium]
MKPDIRPTRQVMAITALLLGCAHALAQDAGAAAPLKLSTTITLTEQTGEWLPRSSDCRQAVPQRLEGLTLMGALEQVLCKSPQLSQALLLVAEQQAGVDLARSAYRPRLSVSAEASANRIPSSNSGSDSLSASVTGSLGLSWVVFDFGVRDANLEQARQTLASARAAQDSATLNAINQALLLYVDAAAAFARLEAAREGEAVNRQSLEAAQAKYQASVGSLSEKLQAETALAQAALERVRAEGAWETARGLLAVAMGLPTGQRMTLAPAANAFPDADIPGDISRWIADAKDGHPRVRSARADIRALLARLDSIKAEGRGNVGMSVGMASTKGLGASAGKIESGLTGYIVASMPIFNRPEQQAREAQVLAQVESRRDAQIAVERDIESELWRSARLMETEQQNLTAAQSLRTIATQSYDITLGRYKAGVGSILELLSTQTALANAQTQVTQAQLSHAQARLRMAVASGRIALRK